MTLPPLPILYYTILKLYSIQTEDRINNKQICFGDPKINAFGLFY